MRNRRLRSINVMFDANEASVSDIENIPNLKELIHVEVYNAIIFARKSNSNTCSLFVLNNSEWYIDLEKENWIPALEQGISFYEKSEQYEKCNLYKTLITTINEPVSKLPTRYRKDNTSNKQHLKNKNKLKAKKAKKGPTRKASIY